MIELVKATYDDPLTAPSTYVVIQFRADGFDEARAFVANVRQLERAYNAPPGETPIRAGLAAPSPRTKRAKAKNKRGRR